MLEFKDENGIENMLEEEETTSENGPEGEAELAEDTVPCKVRKISGESEAHNHANGDSVDSKDDAKKDLTAQEPEIVLNSDLLCIHGKWMIETSFIFTAKFYYILR